MRQHAAYHPGADACRTPSLRKGSTITEGDDECAAGRDAVRGAVGSAAEREGLSLTVQALINLGDSAVGATKHAARRLQVTGPRAGPGGAGLRAGTARL